MKIKSLLVMALSLWAPLALSDVDQVILISVDGLRPDVISGLGKSELPNFYRFREEGVWTDNARSDFDYTRTLPNHASMITARPVIGPNGHGQELNDMPPEDLTLHNNTGEEAYVTSVFDVAHDHGFSTALYASKDKFILFEQSYDENSGAMDVVGEDNGRNKIDTYVYQQDRKMAAPLISQFIEDMEKNSYVLSFIHITDPDGTGHGDNWTTPDYQNAVKRVDGYLGEIFSLIESNTQLRGGTAIVLTADHGGTGERHSDANDSLNYRVPFYVWAPDVAVGSDLYELNQMSRADPADGRPDYDNYPQPIRNGDAANLALALLGLPAIADDEAVINANQDLKITSP